MPMSANEFLELLDASLSPLVDGERTVIASFNSSRGFTGRPGSSNIAVNFINLPRKRHQQRRGGGAESENNHMLFWISGFNEDPSDPVDRIKIAQSVNSIRGAKGMRAKTASPDRIALYLANYINEIANGIPAILGETHRSQAEQAKAIEEGKSAIKEGQTGWHQYGRAFHLVIVDPKTRLLDKEAYKRVGAEVRRRGGEWLGDKTLITSKGRVQDLAHFEYHPGLKLSSYRGSHLAKKELTMAERRAARYG